MGKLKLKILNFVYFALSGFALFWYSLNFINPDKAPFLKIGVDINLTAENSEGIFTDDMLSSLSVTREDLFAAGPLTVEADVQIKNSMLLDVWKSEDPKAFVSESFINPNVNALVDQLEPSFIPIAKSAAKGAVKTIVEDELKKTIAGNGGDLYDTLKAANPELTSEKLSEDIGKVIDVLLSEDATVDSVSEALVDKFNVYNVALGGEEKTAEEMKNEMLPTLEEYNLVDEDGKINDIDEVIALLLDGFLGTGSDEGSGDDSDPEKAIANMLRRANADAEDPDENAISAKLKQFVNEKLDDSTRELIALAMKGCGIALAVFMVGWAIKLLQTILCLFRKKPYVRTELIGIIAGIVQFILALISGLVLVAFKFNLIGMASSLPVVGDIVAKLPFLADGSSSLVFMFSAFIPGILCVVNLIYSIFYGIAKRKFKREYRKQA